MIRQTGGTALEKSPPDVVLPAKCSIGPNPTVPPPAMRELPRIDLIVPSDSFIRSDTSTLHNSAAATRNLSGETLHQPV